ncbi:MAG: hypothetical protein IPN75_03655 [Dechloromonas sp.]|uniref:Uncharacterized protein n=1 Tax=Candidatus Dechloromonas phosphorivorans TaxID=2899244 RepID=A0A9D7LKJ6_9RHOO|nr:hypothetical protein [Candidatus Dechloromonas phosphorivorans]
MATTQHRAYASSTRPLLDRTALGLFPAVGVNAVPDSVRELGRTRDIAMFDGPQPALLPILSQRTHRHYGTLDRHDLAELQALTALVFLESKDAPASRSW